MSMSMSMLMLMKMGDCECVNKQICFSVREERWEMRNEKCSCCSYLSVTLFDWFAANFVWFSFEWHLPSFHFTCRRSSSCWGFSFSWRRRMLSSIEMKSLFKWKRDDRWRSKVKRSIRGLLSFPVNICKWRRRRRRSSNECPVFSFSPSDFSHCESIEDVHENDSRSCQVSSFFFFFFSVNKCFVEEEWTSFRRRTFVWRWFWFDPLWNLFGDRMFGESNILERRRSLCQIFFSSFPVDTLLFDLLGFIRGRSLFSRSHWNRRGKDDHTRWTRTLVDYRHHSSHLRQINARRRVQLDHSTLKDTLRSLDEKECAFVRWNKSNLHRWLDSTWFE
jgi:hypothetical protein